jgi:putative oxidoreductase
MQAFSKLEPFAYAALRVVSGLLFALHGTQKLFGFPPRPPQMPAGPEVFSQIWIGGVIELVAGVLIALGLLTRWAAFVASGTMAVAYFQFHWKGNLENLAWLPSVNQGESAVLYCFIFFFIMARGAGAFGVDRR